MEGTCNSCKKASSELKRCAKCSTTLYCSRDCQKTDWKMHKKICGKQAHERPGSGGEPSAGTTSSPPKGLEKPIANPFTRLDAITYLHDRPEEDVYREYSVVIDAYRLRVGDEHAFEGKTAESSISGFREFLRLAASRAGVLPPWWDAEKQKACEDFGVDSSRWQNINRAVQKGDIIEHYGDPRFPMQLRMLAEMVIGRGIAGNNGTQTRKMMAAMENGGMTGMHAGMVDALTGNVSALRT
ncbi:hypothetical protein NUW58_g716 [Xylaria curta]|uniref:Uncharacterized protein n=2 Tax=Xylaria curta TaxID=42375 RepID=A0ACC1PMH0_9PEZI|nr:hypothetical protein NUW58_g896 [Xylaria curta]KAJ2997218.1 hypothetical protein NUW58_g716 [Xylaria curta]